MKPALTPIPVGGPFHRVGVDILQLPTTGNAWEQLRGMFRRLPDKVGRGVSHVKSVSRDIRKVVGGLRSMPTWCTQGTPFRRSNSCSREVVLKTCIAYSGTPVYDEWREEMNYST